MPVEEIERAKDLLAKLYINLKIQKNDNTENKEDKISQEKQKLKKLSLIDLIKFISNFINCILEIKNMNNKLIEENEEKPLYKQYEELLIKAENDIRKHIKVSKKTIKID